MQTDEQLNNAIALVLQSGTNIDNSNNVNKDTTNANTNIDIDMDMDMDIDENISNKEVDYDFSDQSDKKLPLPNQYFLKFGHKFFMALGMLADEFPQGQTIIGDKGGIGYATICLKASRNTPNLGKWCCWCLLNIVYDHPPNKREFFIKGGLGYTIDCMNKNINKNDLFKQGIALILTIISIDNKTKMSLAKARESCLANGIFDMLQLGKKAHGNDPTIEGIIKKIFDLLMADWS